MATLSVLTRNLGFQVFGRGAGILLSLVSIGILTRHLNPEGFGQLTTAFAFLSIFSIIIDFGLTLTLTQMISEPEADEKRLVGNILSLRLILGFIFFTVAPFVSLLFPYSPLIRYAIVIGAVSSFFTSTCQVLIGIFQKHLIMHRAGLAEFTGRVALLAAVALFAWQELGLLWMIFAFAIANMIQLFATLLLARSSTPIVLKIEPKIWLAVASRSWPIGLSIIFNLVYLKGDIIFLSIFRSQSEVGFYGAAYKVVDVITALPVMFMGIALPTLVSYWHKRAISDFRYLVQQTFDLFSLIALPLAFGVQVVGVQLFALIAGDNYALSGSVARLLVPAASVVFFGTLYAHLIVAVQKQRAMIWAYASVAALATGGYLTVIPVWGMFGAAAVTIAAESLIGLIAFIVIVKMSGAWPRLAVFSKAVLASIIMVLAIMPIRELHVLLVTGIGALVYFIVLLAIDGTNRKALFSLFKNKFKPL
ncbi:MAG: polysaccharide biosynthesis family protein [uncultured bacterium]|nr:MAG: polysaccharide biosynthesis family protein [uncultured bacterium]